MRDPASPKVPKMLGLVKNSTQPTVGAHMIRASKSLVWSAFRSSCTAVMPALVAGIHAYRARRKSWMAGTSPAMTTEMVRHDRNAL